MKKEIKLEVRLSPDAAARLTAACLRELAASEKGGNVKRSTAEG